MRALFGALVIAGLCLGGAVFAQPTPPAGELLAQNAGSGFPPGRWVLAKADLVAALYHRLLPAGSGGAGSVSGDSGAGQAPVLSAEVLERAEELDGMFMRVGGELGLYRSEIGGFPLLITGLPLDGRLFFPFQLETASGQVDYALALDNQSEMATLHLSREKGQDLLAKLGQYRAVSVTFWLAPVEADPLDFQIGVPRVLRTHIVRMRIADILDNTLLVVDAGAPEQPREPAPAVERREDLNIDNLRLGMTPQDVLAFATANGYPRPPAWTLEDRIDARRIGDCVETTAADLGIPPEQRWDWCRAGLADFAQDRMEAIEVRPHGLRPSATMLCPEAGSGLPACYRIAFDPGTNRVIEIVKEDYFDGDHVIEQNQRLVARFGPPREKGRDGGITQQAWGQAPGPRLTSAIALLTDGRTRVQLTLN